MEVRKRGRERGLFWVHRQEHGYKGARKFHIILRGTIFRTVGARMEIDVWASLNYSHLHWWLHARPLSHGWNRALFTINDELTRISRLMTTVSHRSSPCSLFVSYRCFLMMSNATRNSSKQIACSRTRGLPRECISVLYPTVRYLSRIQSSHYREWKLCFFSFQDYVKMYRKRHVIFIKII